MDSQVCVLTHHMAFLSVWQKQRARDSALNQIAKRIILLTPLSRELGDSNAICSIPLVENVADASSRSISYTDSMLSEVVWEKVEEYCTHTVV